MAETLLSSSNVLLFGRAVDDLKVVVPPPLGLITVGVASDGTAVTIPGVFPARLDGQSTAKMTQILLKDQDEQLSNGVYRRTEKGKIEKVDISDTIYYVEVLFGIFSGVIFSIDGATGDVGVYAGGDETHSPFQLERNGLPSQIQEQIKSRRRPGFARIYAFSFEGSYYELPRPVLFLVHGEGIPASEAKTGLFGRPRPSRAPGDPSLTGVGQADFQFSEDVMVWSYDKADYTIRMDVETGMFEDVLLAAILGGGPGGMDAAGMSARGMSARGMSARGMSARGMSARGGNSD
jgi:hypothetical protein